MGGTIVGPIIGGALLEFFWWGAVFLLGVPVMALLLATAPALLPEYRDTNAGRLDLASVALSLAAILPIIYGLKELATDGLEPLPILAIAAGVSIGAVFVRRQRRLPDPLLDLRLFANRSFRAALAIMLLTTITMGGVFLFVTQYLQLVEGLTPLRAGLWLVPGSLVMIVSTMLAPALARRLGPGYVIGTGLAVAAAGLLLLTKVDGTGSLAVLLTGFGITAFGVGPLGMLATELIVGSAPPEKAGSASAMSETSGDLGIALGIATLGSLGTAVYRNQLAGTLPAGISAEVAEATGDTLAGALAATQQLPAALAAEVLEPAREAFTSGLNVVGGVTAAAALVFAVLATVRFHNVRPSSETQPDQAPTQAPTEVPERPLEAAARSSE